MQTGDDGGWGTFLGTVPIQETTNFCYYCGTVGHDDKACVQKHNDSKAEGVKDNQYGAWLKASPVKIPAKRQSEGPEISPSESSSAGVDKERTVIHGNDKVYSRKGGNLKSAKGQIVWNPNDLENNSPDLVMLGQDTGLGRQVQAKIGDQLGPVGKIVPINLPEKAHSVGASFGPSEDMVVKPQSGNGLKCFSTQSIRAFIAERGIQLGVQLQETQTINAGVNDGVQKGSIQKKAESVSQGATGGQGKRSRQTSGRFQRAVTNGESGKSTVLPAKRKGEPNLVEPAVNGPKGPDEAIGMELSGIGESPDYTPIDGTLDGWLSNCGSCRHSWRTSGAMETTVEGGRRREIRSLRAFRQFVNDLGAIDLGFSGYPFTWANRRYGDGLVKERLDRVLVSSDWRLKYDTALVKHLFTVGSDHAALLLDTNPPKGKGFRQFRFDSRWCEDPESHDVVKRSWQGAIRGSKMFEIFQKVRNCHKELRNWSKQKGFNARKKIIDLQQKLESNGADHRGVWGGEIRALEKELNSAWDQEDQYWRQKARNANGEWCDNPDEVANEFVKYFHDIFQSEGTEHMEEVTSTIRGKISGNMNSRLTKDFTRGEIKKALFDMDPTKAPGADGMTAGLFQHYWSIIGEDIINVVQSFFRSGQILRSFNHTHIVLIPKVKTPLQEILSHSIAEFHAFASANAKERAPSQPVMEEVSRWNPPDYGTLKINSDAAFDVSKKRGGIGLVARDYLGQVIWAAAIPILNARSAEVVKALGFRWAVTMAKEKGGEHFLLEGDAQCVIQMLQGVKIPNSSLAVIIRDTMRLSSSFSDVSFFVCVS
ncbi:hypothetical protein Vadar_007104 [Vaccinium darrowii]|uniref:Uncharacterized protein n=1 Tax=Vaccinium darrowii TaxID=229202 RepID=A0ACB7YCP6_9ERIC|nr:hypothetical protein Vadar_007104 [Vaccinium darrowii]